ncbi:hypothetical protein MYX84_14855 [Acidobacteria bacterium AH-259-O06]|nr:hypothetical protein [Acidobacteria bacterium AH-259-O06]
MFQFIKKLLMGKQAPSRELGGWVLFLARPDDDWTDQNRGPSGDETSAQHAYRRGREFPRSPEGARTREKE